MNAQGPTVETSDREIRLSREVAAPRELVWKLWTDPKHLANWWGPTGFSTSTQQHEPKPGGQWRFTMHGPDGRDYENLITYLEVVEPSKLSYKHGGDVECEPVNFQVEVRFEPAGAKGERTRISMRMVFESPQAKDLVVNQYNAIEGGKQTIGRLAEYAASQVAPRSGSEPFVIRRVVHAPCELVYKVWTQQEHLAAWCGPRGVTITKASLELRPGGRFHYGMRLPDGGMMWALWTFREIVPNQKLVFVLTFSDEHGNVTRAPFDQRWPERMLTTVVFEPHAGIGKGTVITITKSALDANAEEQSVFDEGHQSMKGGWGGTLDVLADYLAKL